MLHLTHSHLRHTAPSKVPLLSLLFLVLLSEQLPLLKLLLLTQELLLLALPKWEGPRCTGQALRWQHEDGVLRVAPGEALPQQGLRLGFGEIAPGCTLWRQPDDSLTKLTRLQKLSCFARRVDPDEAELLKHGTVTDSRW